MVSARDDERPNARRRLLVGMVVAVIATMALALPAWACDRTSFRIALDVGHSPEAPGATSARGRPEYAFNLTLAGVVAAHLKAAGFTPMVMTTPGDAQNLPLRAERANELGASLLLSLHHDSVQLQYLQDWTFEGAPHQFSDAFRGWSVFVSTRNARATESLAFARLLGAELLASGLPFTTHHAEPVRGENRAFLDRKRGIYRFDGLTVLRLSNAPAVLLESGVILNRAEEIALASPERQATIAEAITRAAERFCAGW